MKILRDLYYLLNSGKNSKILYYLRAHIMVALPQSIVAWRYRSAMRRLSKHQNKQAIMERVDYYCQLTDSIPLDTNRFDAEGIRLSEQKQVKPSVYYLDSFRYAKGFNPMDTIARRYYTRPRVTKHHEEPTYWSAII